PGDMLRLSFFWLFPIINSSCPDGFDLFRDGQCRGKYMTMDLWWDESQKTVISKCKEINGLPIIIHSQEEQDYWTSKEPVWIAIGLECNLDTNKWEWADGSPIDYKPPDYDTALDQDCKAGCSWSARARNDWWFGCDHHNYTGADIWCTTQLEQPVPSADGCDGFADDSEDGVCYQIGESAENWQGAQMICQQFGTKVASIHNDQENAFIRRLAMSNGAANGVFLGAMPSGKGNDYSWIDGTDWDYDHFNPGFPQSALGDCLAMDTSKTDGYWINMSCSSQLPVACVREQKPVVEPFCATGPWKQEELITSPGFPFSANTSCDYFLTVEVGKKVEAVIELEANSCCDFLEIYDGQVGGALIANLTGVVCSKAVKTTTSNTMRVNWQPNGGVNVRGLAMSFRGVLR
ncbi:hypothetical protein PMAYCL1PPCAC_21768, partial [Pristionchus mayeri]